MGIAIGADLERRILRRPAWRRCRPTSRAAASRFGATSRRHCAILSCVTVKLGQTTLKSFIVGSQGYIGSLLSRRLPRPASKITAPKRYGKVAIRDSSVLRTLSERLRQNFNLPSAT
jgi:hypothetical protein